MEKDKVYKKKKKKKRQKDRFTVEHTFLAYSCLLFPVSCLFSFSTFFLALGIFYLQYVVYHIFNGSVVSRTLTTNILDCVNIACSLESIKPGLVQGSRPPIVGIGLLDNLFGVRPSPTEQVL